MKSLGIAAVVVALASVALGVAAKMGIRLLPGLTPMAFLNFANTAAVVAIALALSEIAGKK